MAIGKNISCGQGRVSNASGRTSTRLRRMLPWVIFVTTTPIFTCAVASPPKQPALQPHNAIASQTHVGETDRVGILRQYASESEYSETGGDACRTILLSGGKIFAKAEAEYGQKQMVAAAMDYMIDAEETAACAVAPQIIQAKRMPLTMAFNGVGFALAKSIMALTMSPVANVERRTLKIRAKQAAILLLADPSTNHQLLVDLKISGMIRGMTINGYTF